MKDAVFLTGAAGFLGSRVARHILERTDRPLIVLIRGRDLSDAVMRLERIWWDWPEMIREIGGRVRVIAGDLTAPRLGLTEPDYEELSCSVRHIIHLAADIRLTEPLDKLRRTNVEGTRGILALARAIHRLHGLTRLSYVSTAYVAGGRKGSVPEEDLTDLYGFSNPYEQSKFEAEALVREAQTELPVSVFRPGMVVGDSRDGSVKTFNTLYFPLRLYLTGKLRLFPVDPSMKINMVPGDYVAEAIAELTFDPQAEGLSFHLTLPHDALPDVREMIAYTRAWAAEKLHVKLPKPVFLPVRVSWFGWMGRFFSEKSTLRSLLALSSYFEEDRVYLRENLDSLLGTYESSWREFFPQILAYACDRGFLHRSERTVQEQAYFRLSRKSRPVILHDVTSAGIVSRSAEEVRHEIDRAVSALRRMGIQTGDRIAVVGFNCSRYFTIDTAIGLCGGVSVPLYYSSPVGELIDIIRDSGARLLFVGVPGILEKLESGDMAYERTVLGGPALPDIPIVSFCRETPGNGVRGHFIEWQEFLKLGEKQEPAPDKESVETPDTDIGGKAPVAFGDIATLRYTSGTTGRPKGAVFDHAGLRSMAETLASLPPWRARTQKVKYLSFLPMNHVVEGILASYAIFFTPAPVEIYYLENFYDLQKALPEARPTIFFSVPRFYEKVWESASKSRIGRLYLRNRDGMGKRLLGKILCRAVKKKAGIGRCAQLIAGSAPVSTVLLQHFRSIGIEIHNAYGLTEAPLITLNRHMANRIGTVGPPLPDTQLRIAEDGEVLVKGPQVMRGYFPDASGASLENGWLHTGDCGMLTDDNYLILSGRKKEVIISSYGKNTDPVKIELMLREATGINHAMVYGDNRPYCTAILFGCPSDDPDFVTEIQEGIERVNRQLSHPEQIKRWAVLAEDLSIAGGELTANLKMKRSAIALKYAELIESLYE